jgi:hypothetical protein
MSRAWLITFIGGAYAGRRTGWSGDPPAVLYLYRCHPTCDRGHITADVDDPQMPIDSATAYQRVDINELARRATYAVGDTLDDPAGADVDAFIDEALGALA